MENSWTVKISTAKNFLVKCTPRHLIVHQSFLLRITAYQMFESRPISCCVVYFIENCNAVRNSEGLLLFFLTCECYSSVESGNDRATTSERHKLISTSFIRISGHFICCKEAFLFLAFFPTRQGFHSTPVCTLATYLRCQSLIYCKSLRLKFPF